MRPVPTLGEAKSRAVVGCAAICAGHVHLPKILRSAKTFERGWRQKKSPAKAEPSIFRSDRLSKLNGVVVAIKLRLMANETRDILLYARLVDLHRRKTEAELMGQSATVYDALIEVYRLELDEIEASRRLKVTPLKAAG